MPWASRVIGLLLATALMADAAATLAEPVTLPVRLYHSPKTGGTAFAYYMDDQCDKRLIHNSRVKPEQHTKFAKHASFDRGVETVVLVRHPLDLCISRAAFRHSGSELTVSRPGTEGGKRPAVRDPATFRKKMMSNANGSCDRAAHLEKKLAERVNRPNEITHILATEKLSEGAPRLMRDLGATCRGEFTPRHISQHPHRDDMFSASEVAVYEKRHPTIMRAWNAAMANGGVAMMYDATFDKALLNES